MSKPSPLAQLTADLRAASLAKLHMAAPGEAPDPQELASARRFRHAWEGMQLLDHVDQAVSRKPPNAGPLNSHMLVLQSLAMMRELSTDYLRRFVASVETLQWLERAREKYPSSAKGKAAVKTGARTRKKK
jgi:hypothetical protein